MGFNPLTAERAFPVAAPVLHYSAAPADRAAIAPHLI